MSESTTTESKVQSPSGGGALGGALFISSLAYISTRQFGIEVSVVAILVSGLIGSVAGNYIEYVWIKRIVSDRQTRDAETGESEESAERQIEESTPEDIEERVSESGGDQPIMISSEPGGGYTIYDPVEELFSAGESREEAIQNYAQLLNQLENADLRSRTSSSSVPDVPWFNDEETEEGQP